MASAREVLAAISRAMSQAVGTPAGPTAVDAALASQIPTQYPSANDARRALAIEQAAGTGYGILPNDSVARFPGNAGAGLAPHDTWENTGGGARERRLTGGRTYTGGHRTTGANPYGAEGGPVRLGPQQPLQGPAMMQGPATMAEPSPISIREVRPQRPYSIHAPPGGAPAGPMHGPPAPRPVGPVALPGQPNPATYPLGTSRATGRGVPVNPRHLPVLHPNPSGPELTRRPGPADRAMVGRRGLEASRAARAVAGQAAGAEIRSATQALATIENPRVQNARARQYGARVGPQYPGGMPMGDPRGPVYGPPRPTQGPTPGTPAGAAPAGAAPAGAKTSFGGFAGWAKGRHKPWEIGANYTKAIKGAKAAGTLGQMGMGGITQRIAKAGIGPSTLGFLRGANPALATAMVGSFLLGDRFEEGTKGDVVAEGLMVGAAFGAPLGGIGALVGAPAFMALNLVTGGAAANLVQSLPLVGSLFGGTGEKEIQPLDIAKDMFANAASAQGMGPEVADAALKNFQAYWQMAEAGMIDRAQLVQMMYQSGRMAGFTGFPWTPEALNPAYSAEDLSAIAQGIGTAMEPFYGVATGLMNMDYSHIQDADLRERLEINSQEIAGNLLVGMQQQAATPAITAITSETQARQGANAALGGQLSDPFEQALLGNMG